MKNSKFFIFSGISLLSVVVIRCIQIAFLINPQNGFFYENYEGVGVLLTVMIIVITVIAALFTAFINVNKIDIMPKENFGMGCVSLLLGLSQISELFMLNGTLEKVPAIIVILRTLFILLSGISFCYLGIMYITKNKANNICIITSVFCWIFRLVSTFISFTGMSNISDNLYDLLTLVSTLVFLLFYSKYITGIKAKFHKNIVLISATVAIIISAVSVLPKVVVALFGVTDFFDFHIDSPVTSLFMTVYIAYYMVNVLISQKGDVDK